MELDFSQMSPAERYRIVVSVVVPRPIAWVTSLDAGGLVNAAPFSYFNAFGSDPAVVAIGIGQRPDGEPKDTLRNITERGEFVVNLVTFAAREKMNGTAADFAPAESEVDSLGLRTAPSIVVRPPRLTDSPVHLECVKREVVAIGGNRIVLGEIVHAHVDDRFFDTATNHVLTDELDLIGRMHGRGWYVRTSDRIEVPRVTPEGARRLKSGS